MLSADDLLDLGSISCGLVFNGSWCQLTKSIPRCFRWTEGWDRNKLLSATLKILLEAEENTIYGTKNLLLVQ